MEIPDQFCICEKQWYKTDVHNETIKKAAQFIINKINDYVEGKREGGKCEELYLKDVIVSIQTFY